jgi:hypothetical protein
MSEVYCNQFILDLASNYTAGSGTLVVSAAAPAAIQTGTFRVRLGNTQNTILSTTNVGTTTTWTVTAESNDANCTSGAGKVMGPEVSAGMLDAIRTQLPAALDAQSNYMDNVEGIGVRQTYYTLPSAALGIAGGSGFHWAINMTQSNSGDFCGIQFANDLSNTFAITTFGSTSAVNPDTTQIDLSTQSLLFTINSVLVVKIDSSGRVLINTATDDGTNKLQVNGGVSFQGNIVATALPSTQPAAGSKQLWYDPADSNRVKYRP